MTRVIVTDLADADTAEILAEIAREAGYRAAEKYNFRIESLYDRLAEHPDSCEARAEARGAHPSRGDSPLSRDLSPRHWRRHGEHYSRPAWTAQNHPQAFARFLATQLMIYGCARVSTDGQSVNAQVKQLRAAGAEKFFQETASRGA